MNKNNKIKKIIISALFIAIGMILPMFTGNIPKVGNALLPMHLPVFLCGIICGPLLGCLVGIIIPILRSFVFGMPPLMPNAIVMAVELFTYGLVIGLLYKMFKKKNFLSILISLIFAMIIGRVAWGLSKYLILGYNNTVFTFKDFIAGGITTAIPGVIFQIIFIPSFVTLLKKMKIF